MPAVTISAFKAAVTKGPLAPVYLFQGSDDFLKEDWVRRLTEAATDPGTRDFNLELLRGAECDAAQLGRALDALPMLADRRLVILRDPSALKKPARERLAKALTNPAADTVLLRRHRDPLEEILSFERGDAPRELWRERSRAPVG